MSAGMFVLFSLIICFLFCSSEVLHLSVDQRKKKKKKKRRRRVCFLVRSSEGQTNIRHEKITAELGEDVTLPCKVPNNIIIRAVEWIRPDLHPDYVLVYRDGHIDLDSQHPSYQNRVDLQDKEMKNGDVSLILKNVTMNDTGRYECRVFEKGKIDPISNITLEVHLSGNKGGNTGDEGNKTGVIAGSVVGVILLLAVLGSVGFLIYRRSMVQNQHVEVPLDERPVS